MIELPNVVPERDRVRARTARGVLAKIDGETNARLRALEGASPDALRARIDELDREWDVDRALMALFSVLGGATFAAGVGTMRRSGRWNRFLSLLSVQIGFLGVHAIAGWCPPMIVLRRLGYRTQKEIERERRALEARLVHASEPVVASPVH